MKKNKTLINISAKTFIQVTILLVLLLIGTIVLTYVIPAGAFGVLPDGTVDYSSYHEIEGGGIPIWKGLLAPILVFFSDDGLRLTMLSLFLLVVAAAFQVMNDAGGLRAIIGSIAGKLRHRKFLAISALSLLFMSFGAFFGLFEELLPMLPVMALFCLSIGFDSFTGFLVCLVSCGFGFASAITNPFTVLFACGIIGADPMEHIWYRIIIFIIMYLLLDGFIYLYVRKISRDADASYTLEHDRAVGEMELSEVQKEFGTADSPEGSVSEEVKKTARVRLVCSTLLIGSLVTILTCSLISALTDYVVVILTAYFLIFGTIAGVICMGSLKPVIKSFADGMKGAVPTVAFIALSASIKYVFDEGAILPTIAHQINLIAEGRNIFVVTLIVYFIILLLEFFISSSTAKAVFVMGILAVVNVGLTDQMSVLIYTFADGYTNLLFPTSPVLLIGLSMVGVDYMKWVRKSIPLFAVTMALTMIFLFLGIIIGY